MASSKDYEYFKDKFVKVLYKDSNKHAVARGILSKETDRMILLEGDYSEIAISKDSIIKISRREQDGARTERHKD